MQVAPASDKLFNLIVKVANFCPLRCSYCYVRPHNDTRPSEVMSLGLVEKILREYNELASARRASGSDGRTIKLTWHGGEPLVAGIEYFERIVALEKRLVHPPNRCVNALTTNGVLIDKKWIDLIREGEFEIAVSLDGPEAVHNTYRRMEDGSPSYDAVMNGIRLLQENHLPFGVMAVVTPEISNRPEELIEFYLAHDLKNLNFVPYTTVKEWLSPSDYTEFLIGLFDAWFDKDDPDLYIRDFANLLARIFGRASNLCEYTNCFGNYLGLDSGGDVYMCDLLIGNPGFLLGNLNRNTIADMLDSKRFRRLKASARVNSPSCRVCSFFLICTGGCMYRRYLSGSLPGKDIYCSTRRSLISHILGRLDQIDRAAKGKVPNNDRHRR